MKPEELKLYNKYKNINIPDRELIYIGIDNEDGDFWFLFKHKEQDISFSTLKQFVFNPEQIVKDLNLETYIEHNGDKCIKGYYCTWFAKEYVEKNFKPILKDKLNNLINR